jgi:hypothetical protein
MSGMHGTRAACKTTFTRAIQQVMPEQGVMSFEATMYLYFLVESNLVTGTNVDWTSVKGDLEEYMSDRLGKEVTFSKDALKKALTGKLFHVGAGVYDERFVCLLDRFDRRLSRPFLC